MTDSEEEILNAAYVLIPRLMTASAGKFFGMNNQYRVRFDTSTVLACEFYRTLPNTHTENQGEFTYISRQAFDLWQSLNNQPRKEHKP